MFPLLLERTPDAQVLNAVFPRQPAPVREHPEREDYLLLSSAMRALFTRCSTRCAQRHFAAALKVYRALRLHTMLHQPLRLCPYLLSDALHEIAAHVERPVRDAALRCLLRMRAAR